MSEITSSIGMLDRMMEQDYQMENTIYLATEIDRNSQVLFCRQLRKLAERELKKKEKDRKPIKIRISSFGINSPSSVVEPTRVTVNNVNYPEYF